MSEALETPKPEEAFVRDLFSHPVIPFRNWAHWLERWQRAEALEEMLGLLHCGFDVPMQRARYGEREYESTDRVLFYLKIADGWRDPASFEVRGEERESWFSGSPYQFGRDRDGNILRRQPKDLRQIAAQKAFDQLSLNFFRPNQGSSDKVAERFKRFSYSELVSESLFPAILHFFRIEEGRFSSRRSIRNLTSYSDPDSRNKGFAIGFLLDFAKLILEDAKSPEPWFPRGEEQKKEEWLRREAATQARLEAAKPWAVEALLSVEGGLPILRKFLLKLDGACVAELHKISFRAELKQYEHPVSQTREVRTLEEACLAGSNAAWLLKERELRLEETERLKAIRGAEIAKANADRRIAELSNKQKS